MQYIECDARSMISFMNWAASRHHSILKKPRLILSGAYQALSKVYTGVSHASGCDMKQSNYLEILLELKTKMAPERMLLPKWVLHLDRIVKKYNAKIPEIDVLFLNVLGETVRQVLEKRGPPPCLSIRALLRHRTL